MSGAEYSFVILRCEDWRQESFTGRDGKQYRAEGYVDDGQGGQRCPTEVCDAVCCRIEDLTGKVGSGPCRFFDESGKQCSLHAEIGPEGKPVSCLVWPKSQGDIDSVNEIAARLGFAGRCQLRVVEVQERV